MNQTPGDGILPEALLDMDVDGIGLVPEMFLDPARDRRTRAGVASQLAAPVNPFTYSSRPQRDSLAFPRAQPQSQYQHLAQRDAAHPSAAPMLPPRVSQVQEPAHLQGQASIASDGTGKEGMAWDDPAARGAAGQDTGGRGKKQSKSERQQMLNKAAQQRYRERKKAKAMELKQAVASLQDKVQELSVVHAEKDALQERVSALEKELATKEAKLASLQTEGTASGMTCSGAGTGDESTESGATEYAQHFLDDVNNLREWLAAHGYSVGGVLRPGLTAADVPQAPLVALRTLAERSYSSCTRYTGRVTDVESSGLAQLTHGEAAVHFQGQPADWHALVSQLQLSTVVKEHALQLRGQYMAKLESLFNERQALNLEAVKVLLPQEVGGMSLNKAKAAPALFEKFSSAYKTASVLRRLRGNLAEEQKALAELDYLVYIKLLNPVQLARCILTAFPQHCDVVSLLNAVLASQGDQ